MTLHEAIIQVLNEKLHEMRTKDIADEINSRRLYTKKDGTDVTAFQIHGRTRKYHKLFTRTGSMVGLIECEVEPKIAASHSLKKPSITLKSIEESWIQTDVTTITFLEKSNFTNIGSIKKLFSCGLPSLPELGSCGLYAISIPKNYSPSFVSVDITRTKKNVIRPRSLQYLTDKWVNQVDIVYYGLAGFKSPRSLKKRLSDLINHGLGKTRDNGPHKGGEIMWQLQGYEGFSVWIKPTGYPPEPRKCEHGLLVKFRENTGKLPFANRQL